MTQDQSGAVGRASWTVVMPVKSLSLSKTRLDPDRVGAGESRALAFFLDTASAALCTDAVARVVVASADPVIAAAAGALGCDVVDDDGHPGINAAAAWAATVLGVSADTAVIVSDLPCLTPSALTAVLRAVPETGASFVPDASGTGTTMWIAAGSVPIDCEFGPDSAAAHRAAGAVDLADETGPHAPIASARRDVDTDADFAAALALGVGPHTRALLEAEPGGLLLTVARTRGRSVSVVEESGRFHWLPARGLASAGFRDVRPGQRVVLWPAGGITLP
ncbi:MAG: 2-phospho-L-lactate guanylyltransferase [Actinomycetota bacterium]|nr:2-phospho-L-lactate guanylyltransferase [Actinomycetota bacterium]